MLRKKLSIALIMLVYTLSGCMHLPTREKTEPVSLDYDYMALIDLKTSPAWHDDITQNPSPPDTKWWKLYKDAELDALMENAFLRNPNINQIRARLKQAQALSKQSRASLLPSLDIIGQSGASRGDDRTPSNHILTGAASFEVDLWNKNRANLTSKQLEAQASVEDLHSATITLSASIVENWLDILSLLEQEALLRKQINVNRTVLELQGKRFEMGSSSALDILQQEEILARSEAGLPDILSAQKQAANNIALLIGNTPHEQMKISLKAFPEALTIPNTGLPSDLLENRPDIMAAWLRLLSADWAAKAAWADRLPRFNLSSSYSTSATALNGLFNTWLLDIAANIAAPIFDGGNRKAEQLRQEAIADERYHTYRETILGAVIDVENALIRNTYQDRKLVALTKQLSASRQTLEQAQLSYVNGRSSYINVLSSLNNTQSLEQQIAKERLAQAKERVGLYRVLGGRSWENNLHINDHNELMKETEYD